MGSPYAINASLNLGTAPCTGELENNPLGAYTLAYDNYLSINKQNYSNIVSGYNKILCAANQQEQQVEKQYACLQKSVLKTICGICQSQMQNVQKTYTQQMGLAQNQLIGSGLGNSTVLASQQRGITACEAMAQTAVQNQFAQLKAGYQSSLGLAALNYQGQAISQNMGFGAQALSFLAGIQAPPPNMCGYAKMYYANKAAAAANMPPLTTGVPPGACGLHVGTGIPHQVGQPNIGCQYGGGGGGGTLFTSYGGSGSGASAYGGDPGEDLDTGGGTVSCYCGGA